MLSHLISAKRGGKGGLSRRAKRAATSATASSGDEESRRKGKSGKTLPKKALRRWDADGMADEDDGVILDYSAGYRIGAAGENNENSPKPAAIDSIDVKSAGIRDVKGQFLLKDLESKVHSILDSANEKKWESASQAGGALGSSLGAISGLFRNVVGGKVLTKDDLEKPMKGMEEHLLNKNVARAAAVRLCDGVEREMIGVKTGSFESNITSFLQMQKCSETNMVLQRRRNSRPCSYGIISEKDSYPNNITRHPSLYICCQLPV